MKVKSIISVSAAAFVLTGCGKSDPEVVPDLRYERLDVAEERLDRLGLGYEEVGGGALGIVVRSNWRVCRQEPAPGKKATEVRLIVDRHCPPPPVRQVVLPDLVGDPLEQAEAALEKRDVPYEVASWTGRRLVRAGARVCDQEPDAGRRAEDVILYVAADCSPPAPPPPPPPLPVPDVVGLDLSEAQEVLSGEGIDQVVEPPWAEAYWDVCAQSRGNASTVTLYVERNC
jgi:beta-lactam-binding protein with PASTA domain